MFISYLPLLLTCLAVGNAQTNSCDVFDPTEATIDSIHLLLGFPIVAGGKKGNATCTQIVQGYLAKIIALNPKVNAIITLNPSALMIAGHHDMLIKNGTAKGALFCIPVLLKDNYDTMDMPTTGSSLSLKGSQPSKGNNSNENMYHWIQYIYVFILICK
jgi:Asp-tRNA(Asn)/Glu-tRNA(Gln) amidotransferase A subunit family amidase